jgi:hypothetical protein
VISESLRGRLVLAALIRPSGLGRFGSLDSWRAT